MDIKKNTKLAHEARQRNAGFTIVELMIAISVFSVLLLICTIGIIRISQSFYKGIIQSNTQQAARTIIDDVGQNFQYEGHSFFGQSPQPASPVVTFSGVETRAYCIGPVRYTYALNYQQSPTNNIPERKILHGLWRDVNPNPSVCNPVDLTQPQPSSPPSGSDGREMLGENMRVMDFGISQPLGTNNLYSIKLVVLYGNNDTIDFPGGNPADASSWATVSCQNSVGILGNAFCARAAFETTVGKRIR